MGVMYFDQNAFYRIVCVNKVQALGEPHTPSRQFLTHSAQTDTVVFGPDGEFSGWWNGQAWMFQVISGKEGVWTLHSRLYGLDSALEMDDTGRVMMNQKQPGKLEQEWRIEINPDGRGKWELLNLGTGRMLSFDNVQSDEVKGGSKNVSTIARWDIQYVRPIKMGDGNLL